MAIKEMKHSSHQVPTTALSQPRVGVKRWAGWLFTVGIIVLLGVWFGLLMPRGPVTTMQVLMVMGFGLITGLISGLAIRSRWVLLAAPLAHVLAIEITRLGAVGPTVDAIRLDNPYGILALLLGRGFHGLVGLFPMILGAGISTYFIAEQAARTRGTGQAIIRKTARIRNFLLGLGILDFIVLAVLFAIPARTPAILGSDGQPITGSIASLEKVNLGGIEQWIMIRAQRVDKPILLYLSGGPGQSDLPYSRVLYEDLTHDFVVVSWDQRGTGKSYSALDPSSALTLDQVVNDTIELSEYLRTRFGEEKIYMLGESWGSTLGVLAVQRRPDLYYAWIGSGQMVSQRETDKQLYWDLIALAEQTDDSDLKSQMMAFGEPPYADIPFANVFVMGLYERLYQPYTPPAEYIQRGTAANLGPWGILGSEYNLVEKVNVLRGLMDMFTVLYPQLQGIDFRQDVTRLEVPVYILDGQAELTSRRDLVLDWFERLDAPIKQIYSFENAGHSVAFEQFAEFHKILTDDILPVTYPGY